MDYSLFRSKTFWTIVAMFVIGGLNAIVHVLPDGFQALAEAILAALAASFHLNTAIKAGARN